MKFAVSVATSLAFVCLWMGCADASEPMYGALSVRGKCDQEPQEVYPPPTSYVARMEKARVGIYPEPKYGEKAVASCESSEERTVDHYEHARKCFDSHGRLLPVSICVQLPPEAPMKLSKDLLQKIVYSLMQDPKGEHPVTYGGAHNKPCEYPRKPCSCAKKPKESCEEPKDVYTPPKKPYEPPMKVYEPTPKPPCGKPTPSYEPTPKKPYVPKSSCEVHAPVYGSAESYEAPNKPYTPPKKPCSEPKEYYPSPPKAYTPPPKVYNSPPEPYNPPKESYPRPMYGVSKEPCGATEPPYYQPTTVAPYTTAAPAYTPPPPHRPTPYHPTATYAPYAPRYPSVSYHAPSYPKPVYDPKPAPYHESPPPKKSCGCSESQRPYYNSSA